MDEVNQLCKNSDLLMFNMASSYYTKQTILMRHLGHNNKIGAGEIIQ